MTSISMMHDLELSDGFRRWRRITRWTFLAGVATLLAAWADDIPQRRFVLIAIGAVLIVVVIPLYFCWCNRCPRCRHSFSTAEAFRDEETNGLPLFNDIDNCPFCGLDLDSRRYF